MERCVLHYLGLVNEGCRRFVVHIKHTRCEHIVWFRLLTIDLFEHCSM